MATTRSLVQGWVVPRAALVVALTLVLAISSRADFVFLDDGTTLQGRIQREGTAHIDPVSGQPVWMPRYGNYYVVDDGARRIVFSSRRVREAVDAGPRADTREIFRTGRVQGTQANSPKVPAHKLREEVPWGTTDKRFGIRDIVLQNRGQDLPIKQIITDVTPHVVRAGGMYYKWNSYYLTQELPPADLIKILRGFLKEAPDQPSVEARLRIIRFCMQAGWLEHADAELKALHKDQPQSKYEYAELEQQLKRLQAQRIDEEVQWAVRAGQHQRAQQLLENQDLDFADDNVLLRARTLRGDYQDKHARLEAVRRLFAQARRECRDTGFLAACDGTLAEIERLVNFDTLDRVAVFLKLAQQEERWRTQGKPAETTPEQLLTLAISGWLLGENAAETNTASALRLAAARDFLARYLREPDELARKDLITAYQKRPEPPPLQVDEMRQFIEMLPTLAWEADTKPQNGRGQTRPTPNWPRGVEYVVRVPPEYHAFRAYPLLVVIPKLGEAPEDALKPWLDQATRRGYLLAAPVWYLPDQSTYEFTVREHEAVLETILDIRRRFHLDSDRVCLAGAELGGSAVYDIALGHPDWFAGAVVMSGLPGGEYAGSLRNNAQYLPFYVVDGMMSFDQAKDGTGPNKTQQLFDYWIPRAYPSLYVQYKGRGQEFFTGEVPYIFDWLDRKRRSPGLPELGKADVTARNLGQEFRSIRPNEDRFYWLSSSDVPATLKNQAKWQATVQTEGNAIVVNVTGIRQLTVWLNDAMVDFNQPVEVRVNPASPARQVFRKVLKPSLAVLLEDFYRRGDRKQLYQAKVEFSFKR